MLGFGALQTIWNQIELNILHKLKELRLLHKGYFLWPMSNGM